ncbi:DUF1328 domain-containing protein [Chitinispirillales bacterium ANBcel5]|uniref:DUF1328 family protein n=1 Tax=Cellulosispirillum alkaliphilum TaxID=3039283 RepID=UPI002A4E32BB|nr:DUF1328 domain-containing protein [Chitinispirillales bacterium ANBcel5]
MLLWLVIFLLLAALAALFGFTEIAVSFAQISRALFFLFILLLITLLLVALFSAPVAEDGPGTSNKTVLLAKIR